MLEIASKGQKREIRGRLEGCLVCYVNKRPKILKQIYQIGNAEKERKATKKGKEEEWVRGGRGSVLIYRPIC